MDKFYAYISVISLYLIGVILIALEVLVVPGIPFVGMAATVILIFSIGVVYYYFGHLALIYAVFVVLSSIFLIFILLKSKIWNIFALTNKVDTGELVKEQFSSPKIGEEIITCTDLKPIGKALFNENKIIVYSHQGFVPNKTLVKVILIENNKIFVKPLN